MFGTLVLVTLFVTDIYKKECLLLYYEYLKGIILFILVELEPDGCDHS